MNRLFLLLLTALLLIVSCGDEYYGTNDTDNTGGPYSIETEPSLSPNKDYIYYIANDTATNLYSGIYRASIADPHREKVLYGHTYHSPTLNFDNNIIAYIENNIIKYYDISNDSSYVLDSITTYESIAYVRENVLIACRADSIYSIEGSSATLKTYGYDPVFIGLDSFVYIYPNDDDTYEIRLYKLPLTTVPEVLLSINSNDKPRWASFMAQSNRLAFSIESSQSDAIYTRQVVDTGTVYIAASDYAKPLVILEDMLIFTGPDGRFYRSNGRGTSISPFVYVKQ